MSPPLRLPEINGIRVDTDALFRIEHHCCPELCGMEGSCCARYEICIDPEEVNLVAGFMPEAARYATAIVSRGGLSNIFDETEDGLLAIDRDDDDLCVLAYRADERRILCSLHSAALDCAIEPHIVKPRCCVLWPLALGDGKKPVLSVDEDAFGFPCNTLRDKPARELDSSIEETVRNLFGPGFLEKLSAIGL